MPREKKYKRNSIIKILCTILSMIILSNVVIAEATYDKSQLPKKIRVGWYESKGFQEKSESGLRSGYGYEYLQMMAIYGGWTYEYVEGTREECIGMLKKGEVDIVGGITDTLYTKRDFDFSEEYIKEEGLVLFAAEDNEKYKINDYNNFNNIRVAIIPGDVKQSKLEEFSKERQFFFKTVRYTDMNKAYAGLNEGVVDAILTSYVESGEYKGKIIAQLKPLKKYFVTKKGNTQIQNAVDYAMKQVKLLSPEFRMEVEKKYFRGYKGQNLELTMEEEELLESMSEIRVTLASFRRPMVYKENGSYEGISIDVLKHLEGILGVKFVFVEAPNQLEAVKLAKEGKTDLISNVYYDFGWAEVNSLLISKPYMELDYVALVRVGDVLDTSSMKIAAVKGYLFSENYILKNYDENNIIWYNSEEECLKAVIDNKADLCFANTFVANTYIQDYEYRGLYSSIINYSHGLSLGCVKGEKETLLMSIINKAITAMSTEELYAIIAKDTMFLQKELTLGELILRYPVTFASIFGGVILLITSGLAIFVIYRNNRKKEIEIYKAKMAAQKDSITGLYNRLAFELLTSERLAENNCDIEKAFIMLDVDDFKTVNDTKGHSYGDQVLITLANTMSKFFAQDSLLCRMGGDEFAVYVPTVNSREDLYEQVEKFRLYLKEGAQKDMPVSCSIGIFVCNGHNTDFETMYKRADASLYNAKRSGKGKIDMN